MKDEQKRESVGLWLTNACNLNCTYCYIREKDDRTMSLEKAMEILRPELNGEGGRLEICFMGAEPLTRFERIREIVETVCSGTWKRPYVFVAATNGTLLREEMKPWLTAHRDHLALALSYDGDTAQLLNRTPHHEPVDIDYFLETWPMQPWKITISEEAAGSVDRDLIALHERGVRFTANVAYEEKRWSPASVREYELALMRLAEYYARHPDVRPCNLLGIPLSAILCKKEDVMCAYCSAGESFRFYDFEGRVYPCHLFSQMVCAPEQTIEGGFWPEGTDFTDPRCAACEARCVCYTCMGDNWLRRGDIRFRDDQHCGMFRAQLWAIVHYICEKYEPCPVVSTLQAEEIRQARAIALALQSGRIGR